MRCRVSPFRADASARYTRGSAAPDPSHRRACPASIAYEAMRTSGVSFRALSRVLFLVALLFGAGCGGERIPPQLPAASPVRQIVVRVVGSPEAAQRHALSAVFESLRVAGYHVTRGEGAADVTVAVDIEPASVPVAGGFLVVSGPNAVRLTLTLSVENQVVETFDARLLASDEGVAPEDVDELMANVTASPRVYQFAAATLEAHARAARVAEEQREAERRAREAEQRAREERERRAREEEAAAWEGAGALSCSAPTTIDACEGVRQFVAKYPSGERAAAARDLLAKAEEPLRALRDDRAWETTDHAACEKPKAEDGCEPVHAYLSSYPSGRHADEARELLAKAEKALAKLRAAKEAREAAEAARERAAAAAVESSDESYGGGSSRGGASSRGGGSVHVRGYTRRDGTYVAPHTRRRPRR